MIRPADSGVFDSLKSYDPFFTRILSLYLAYGDGDGAPYDFVAFWEQENGGDTVSLISRFEDKFSLYLTDRSDLEEIEAFVRFQGAGSVMYDSAFSLDILDAEKTISGEVLEYTGDDYNSDLEIYKPGFKEVYDLLKTCESDIFRVPEYLSFLSDLTHRKNMSKLSLLGIKSDGVLVSSVMTVSETPLAAILGAVATRPGYRGRGLSRNLVRSLATELRKDAGRVFVFSASEGNTRFYINSGFETIAGFKEIIIK